MRGIAERTIQKIEFSGPLVFETIIPALYDSIHARWKAEFGIDLPPRKELAKFGIVKDLRICYYPVTITITFSDSGWFQFHFDRGWISDLASVPWFFRSVVDNDDSQLLPAAMIHDYLFSTHRLNFKDTNRLLRAVSLFCGYSPARAFLAWLAVSSPAGMRRWKINSKKRENWTEQTADFLDPRSI